MWPHALVVAPPHYHPPSVCCNKSDSQHDDDSEVATLSRHTLHRDGDQKLPFGVVNNLDWLHMCRGESQQLCSAAFNRPCNMLLLLVEPASTTAYLPWPGAERSTTWRWRCGSRCRRQAQHRPPCSPSTLGSRRTCMNRVSRVEGEERIRNGVHNNPPTNKVLTSQNNLGKWHFPL